jgi:hypothetical protein
LRQWLVLLNIDAAKIKEIRLWRYIILVVADGMSRFVSYAEIPPILGVAPLTVKDFHSLVQALAQAKN